MKSKTKDILLFALILFLSAAFFIFAYKMITRNYSPEVRFNSQSSVYLPAVIRVVEENNVVLLGGNTLMAVSAPNYEYKIVYASIVSKLIECESQGDKWAMGKANEKGILQFKDSTFQHFCVERYGLPDNIWSADIQKECCDRMIGEGYIKHWSCYSKI